jgi:hypothetical protein
MSSIQRRDGKGAENMYAVRQKNAKSGFIGIWLGIVIGMLTAGIITLLYTHESGKDKRIMLKDRA